MDTVARKRAHLHFLAMSLDRALPFDGADIARLEDLCRSSRPCFEISGKTRYSLRLVLGRRERYGLVYDTELDGIVTAWRASGRSRRRA